MNCRGCGGTDLAEIIDLGAHHLTDFRDDPTPSPTFPLRLLRCETCTLIQLAELTPRELMYTDRYGFRSGVNEAIRHDLADIVGHAASAYGQLPGTWLDIACNDGTLLSMVPSGVERTGCDPVAAFTAESNQHGHIVADYFDASDYPARYFDVVTSISMFYDVAEIDDFVEGVASVLAPGGVWVIQQNYALDMLTTGAVDNVSHEHVTYFTLTSLLPILARHGLYVTDATRSTVNGGCFRTVVRHLPIGALAREASPSVGAMLQDERDAGMRSPATWLGWASRVHNQLQTLADFVHRANSDGETVAVYGASTRGGTLYQAAGLHGADFCYAVERQPGKVGKWMSSIGVPIVSEGDARTERPNYMVVSPWFFRDVFVHRERRYLADGGALVFPLPTFEVVRGE